MTTQTDFQEAGEDFLSHFGKKGMKWGQRTHKAPTGKRPVSRKRAVSYTVAGSVGGAVGALGLVAANRVLRSSDAKMKSKNAFKRGLKSTLLVTAKVGSVVVPSILAGIGAHIIGENITTVRTSSDSRIVPTSSHDTEFHTTTKTPPPFTNFYTK